MTEDKSALDYKVYNKDYPLHSHASILNVGAAGSGKSFFCYRVILPIYIKKLNIKSLIICSRTGAFDHTTATELKNPIYKNVAVEFVKIEDSFKRCQEIRGQAIINEYLEKCLHISTEKELIMLRREFIRLINADSKVPHLVDELRRFDRDVLEKFTYLDIGTVHDYAELMFNAGDRYVKDTDIPILIVFDDYAGSREFLRVSSDIHQLIFCRRHLRTTMVMNVQALTTVSSQIRGNSTVFVCFSTLSEKDIELLSQRVPYSSGFNRKSLKEAFIKINESEQRNQQMLTLFTVKPNAKVVLGAPACVEKYLPKS